MHALIGPNGAGKSTLPERAQRRLRGDRRAASATASASSRGCARTGSPRSASRARSRTSRSRRASSVLDNLLVARHRLMRAGLRRRRAQAAARAPRARRARGARARDRRAARPRGRSSRPVGDAVLRHAQARRAGARAVRRARAAAARRAGRGHGPRRVDGDGRRRSPAPARELGISVLLVEHDMAFVMGIADRVTVLDFGQRIADGTPAEVQRDPEVLSAPTWEARHEPVRRRCSSAASSSARSTRSSRSAS